MCCGMCSTACRSASAAAGKSPPNIAAIPFPAHARPLRGLSSSAPQQLLCALLVLVAQRGSRQ